jgi:hypothetical protein
MSQVACHSPGIGAGGTGSSIWQRVQRWCGAAAPARATGAQAPLQAAQLDFCRALRDIGSLRCELLLKRVGAAKSRRDLWHLRAELFGVVALHAGEAAAMQRLRSLAHHFPTRASSSGLMLHR